MEIVLVDLGTYSIKILRGNLERRNVQYFDFFTKTLSTSPVVFSNEDDKIQANIKKLQLLEKEQFQIIEEYLKTTPLVEKLIISIPSHYYSSRFFNLPVKNKKKIEKIIPFQLEEELPYPVRQAHITIASTMTQKGSHTIAFSSNNIKFKKFYQRTQTLPIFSSGIISIESIYQALAVEKKYFDPLCHYQFWA